LVCEANVPGFSKSKHNISDNVWKHCDFPWCDEISTVAEKLSNNHLQEGVGGEEEKYVKEK